MKIITIGRSRECTIVIDDVKVSRVHAQLVQNDNGNISVVDLGSTNGTLVNGIRIAGETRLHPGDELRLGGVSLPWQDYIATVSSQATQSASADTPSHAVVGGEDTSDRLRGVRTRKTLLWIVLAVVLGLIITGGVVWMSLSRETGPSSNPLRDTIFLPDTTPSSDSTELTDYEQWLIQTINEKDSALNRKEKIQSPGARKQSQGIEKAPPTEDEFKTRIDGASNSEVFSVYQGLVNNGLLSNEDVESFNKEVKMAGTGRQTLISTQHGKWRTKIVETYKNSDSKSKIVIYDLLKEIKKDHDGHE